MKYIKYDNEICEVDIIKGFAYWENNQNHTLRLSEEGLYENFKVADTIEELCDRYIVEKRVYTKKGFKKYVNYRMKQDNTLPKRTRQEIIIEINYYDTVYGAIWTKWGLKYVAKMNEKGEWELL